MRWSPDGTKLIFAYHVDTDTEALALHDITTGETRNVFTFPKGRGPMTGAWSADGRLFALVRYRDDFQFDLFDSKKVEVELVVLDTHDWQVARRVTIPGYLQGLSVIGPRAAAAENVLFLVGDGQMFRIDLQTGAVQERKSTAKGVFGDGRAVFYRRPTGPGDYWEKKHCEIVVDLGERFVEA